MRHLISFSVSAAEIPSEYQPKLQLSLGGYVRCDSIYFQVYTVGPDYAHAEARKSPALDGKVERDSEGKEIRYPVMLTAMEKLVARKVCVAFKVCIFFPVQAGLHKCLSVPGLVLKLVILACLRHGNPTCLMPVVGPAGCGSLLGRGDWAGWSVCSKCPLGWQVPGVPHTSECLILDPEHASLHLSCAHPVLTISCFCLCGKFGFIFLVFVFFFLLFFFLFAFWYLCLVLLFVWAFSLSGLFFFRF